MAGNFFQQAFEKTKSFANQAVDGTKYAAQKTKIKSRISSENGDLNRIYTEIGRYYYNQDKDHAPEEIKNLFDAATQKWEILASLDREYKKVEEQEARLANAGKQNTMYGGAPQQQGMYAQGMPPQQGMYAQNNVPPQQGMYAQNNVPPQQQGMYAQNNVPPQQGMYAQSMPPQGMPQQSMVQPMVESQQPQQSMVQPMVEPQQPQQSMVQPMVEPQQPQEDMATTESAPSMEAAQEQTGADTQN